MRKTCIEHPKDPVCQQELEHIAACGLDWSAFSHKTVLVTGATGLVGSYAVRALAAVNRIHDCDMTILAMVRNIDKAKHLYGSLLDRGDVALVIGDVRDPIAYEGSVDYIIHGASVTASKEMVTRPVETIATAIGGTEQILKFAVAKQVTSMVYISSMEMYGTPDPNLPCVTESDYGRVDVLQVRSCYPEGKRMCECLCAAYAHEYQLPVKIARLAQTFGAGVSTSEGRVFAQFARSLMKGEDIVLHTEGKSYGNYCATCDCVRGLLTILLRGVNGEAYNVANEKTNIRIRDMAQMIADQSDGKIQVRFDIPEDALKYGYAPDVKMRLSGDKLRGLGWEPELDLPQMYRQLMASWQAQEAAADKGENA